MRIAQVSPLWERVPPPGYGGIELVVSHLTDELVRRGHEVTLFASGDSITLARLESVVSQAVRLDPSVKEPIVHDLLQLGRIAELAQDFDLIHFHNAPLPLPIADWLKTPFVHTLHGRFNPENYKLYEYYAHQLYISISNAQRQGGPKLNYVSTVYNGINPDDYAFNEQPQDPPYLAFLGRLSEEKGPHHAITIAKQLGWPLKMAGKVDVADRSFFEQAIAPLIDGEQIQYLGELSHAGKVELLAKAAVTLFPITWPEPFGLVMTESMATGTPVIAMNFGSVSEVIAHKKTGYICSSLEEMSAAVPAAMELDRRHCREYVEQFFSVTPMVDGYEAAYETVLGQLPLTRRSAISAA